MKFLKFLFTAPETRIYLITLIVFNFFYFWIFREYARDFKREDIAWFTVLLLVWLAGNSALLFNVNKEYKKK